MHQMFFIDLNSTFQLSFRERSIYQTNLYEPCIEDIEKYLFENNKTIPEVTSINLIKF